MLNEISQIEPLTGSIGQISSESDNSLQLFTKCWLFINQHWMPPSKLSLKYIKNNSVQRCQND